MIPDPRPEVVELLQRLIREFVETGCRAPEWDDRSQWATGAERKLAMSAEAVGITAEVVAYRAVADQQDAELRRSVFSDDKWLRDTGIMP